MARISDASALGEGQRDSRVGLVLAERYRVDALVDEGAMGRVYVGEHVLMRKRVAIKVLRRELTKVPEFVARFEREAMAAANIENEHVVAATDFGRLSDGAVFLVLEFIEGKNLRDEIAQGPIPLVRSLHIARQIAYALRSAHALSIVHRDLKPENVMLVEKAGDRDFVKVLDFGIAKVPLGDPRDDVPSSRPITKAGMVFGTPEYMPPEQALGQDVDHRADIYALGVILYEMLAGVRPFLGTSGVGLLGEQLQQSAPPISRRTPAVVVPPAVENFIGRLLAREAKHRVQTAQAVLEEIDRHLGYAPSSMRIPTLRHGTDAGASDTDPAPRPERNETYDDLPTSLRMLRPGQGPLQRLGAWIDSRKSSWPARVRNLPAPILFSVPLAVVGLLLGFGLVSALSPDRAAGNAPAASASAAPSASPAPPTKADASELETATAGGREALEALAAKYPNDAKVQLALSAVDLQEKDLERAVGAIATALSLDPALKNDGQIASALWITAQNKKSSVRAFEVLKGPMGDRGRAILTDLAATPAVKPAIRAQAKQALSDLGPPKP